jgi:citrate synthase
VADETLSIRDNRTGNEVEIPITDGTIHATDLRQLGLMSYDPAFLNTASTRSGITYIDGDAGILRYRGYPIEQLAEHASCRRATSSQPGRRRCASTPTCTRT